LLDSKLTKITVNEDDITILGKTQPELTAIRRYVVRDSNGVSKASCDTKKEASELANSAKGRTIQATVSSELFTEPKQHERSHWQADVGGCGTTTPMRKHMPAPIGCSRPTLREQQNRIAIVYEIIQGY
jgi:hypothetical protein